MNLRELLSGKTIKLKNITKLLSDEGELGEDWQEEHFATLIDWAVERKSFTPLLTFKYYAYKVFDTPPACYN